jgi:hypothetical protein
MDGTADAPHQFVFSVGCRAVVHAPERAPASVGGQVCLAHAVRQPMLAKLSTAPKPAERSSLVVVHVCVDSPGAADGQFVESHQKTRRLGIVYKFTFYYDC